MKIMLISNKSSKAFFYNLLCQNKRDALFLYFFKNYIFIEYLVRKIYNNIQECKCNLIAFTKNKGCSFYEKF